MKLSDLKENASLLECQVLFKAVTGGKLWALYDNDTRRRVSPFYLLAEWEGKNVAKVVLDYLKNSTK